MSRVPVDQDPQLAPELFRAGPVPDELEVAVAESWIREHSARFPHGISLVIGDVVLLWAVAMPEDRGIGGEDDLSLLRIGL